MTITCGTARHSHTSGKTHPLVIKCRHLLPVQLRRYGIAPHVHTDPHKPLWGGDPHELGRGASAWIGVGTGGQYLENESDRSHIIAQGDTIYKLMSHHASYEPLPVSGWISALPSPDDDANGDAEGESEATEPRTTIAGEGRDVAKRPTVFTDGSVKPARPAWLTTAGIGA